MIIASVVMGFLMTACSTPSPKQAIMDETDEFFAKAEQEVQAITNAEDFVDFFFEFDERRDDYVDEMFEKYPTDKDGNIKGMTEAEIEELNNFIYDRATAYNRIEAKKCGEFLAPFMDEFEKATKEIYAEYQKVGELTDEMHDKLFESYEGVAMFEGIDNVPSELIDRYNEIMTMADEMLGVEYGEDEE